MIDGLVAAVSAFLGSTVESVEALTIVLAVGVVNGWRTALQGVAAALALLALVGAAAPLLLGRLPERTLLGAVGVVLVLVGARWLRKAVLRAAGVVPLHDEAAAYRTTVSGIEAGGRNADWRGGALAFQGVVVEGVEVVVIVAAAGSGGHLAAAGAGGAAGVLLVVALGVALRRPLERIPENVLKLGVGVMLCALGTFWAVEGMGYGWPGDTGSLAAVVAAFAAVAAIGVAVARRLAGPPAGGPGADASPVHASALR